MLKYKFQILNNVCNRTLLKKLEIRMKNETTFIHPFSIFNVRKKKKSHFVD